MKHQWINKDAEAQRLAATEAKHRSWVDGHIPYKPDTDPKELARLEAFPAVWACVKR